MKTDTTRVIEACLMELFYLDKSQKCALEVSVILMGEDAGRVDFLAFDSGGVYTAVEIKVSVNDFRSKNGHNLYFHKNYYATTEDVYEKIKDEIPAHVGVYLLDVKESTDSRYESEYFLRCKKRCKRQNVSVPNRIREYYMFVALNSAVRRLTSELRYEKG